MSVCEGVSCFGFLDSLCVNAGRALHDRQQYKSSKVVDNMRVSCLILKSVVRLLSDVDLHCLILFDTNMLLNSHVFQGRSICSKQNSSQARKRLLPSASSGMQPGWARKTRRSQGSVDDDWVYTKLRMFLDCASLKQCDLWFNTGQCSLVL